MWTRPGTRKNASTNAEKGTAFARAEKGSGVVINNDSRPLFSANADGQATVTIDPDGHIDRSYYDADGNLTGTADGFGFMTSKLYDADGRLTEVIDPRGATTYRSYDQDGNLTGLVDPDNNLTSFAYNADDQQISMTDPQNHTKYTYYDADGRVTGTLDRDGRRTQLGYDDDGELTQETWYNADGSIQDTQTWTYNADGLVLTASNNAGTYTYLYNADGQVTSVQEPNGLSLSFLYDADGHVTQQTDNFGGVVASVYNSDGLLQTREFYGPGQSPLRIDYGYDGDGNLTSITRYADLAGTQMVSTTSRQYDGDGLLTGLVDTGPNNTVLASYSYTYDLVDRLASETDNGVTTVYGYDASSALTSLNYQIMYNYDLAGNRTTSGYQTGTGNQLLSDGTWTMSYDGEGNLIHKVNSSGVSWDYTYNDANQVTSAVEKNGSTVLASVSYSYDVYGQQISRSDSSTGWVGYGYNLSGNIWADVSSSGSLQMRRIFGDDADEPLARETASGTVAWYLVDHLGSVRALTDNSGNVIDQVSYDAFGQITSETAPSSGDRYKFTGMQLDATTGDYDDAARTYSAADGRFEEDDPEGFDAGDSNLYPYCNNGPTDGTDPTGRYLLTYLDKGQNEWLKWLGDANINASAYPIPGRFYNRSLAYIHIPLDQESKFRWLVDLQKGIDPEWKEAARDSLGPGKSTLFDAGWGHKPYDLNSVQLEQIDDANADAEGIPRPVRIWGRIANRHRDIVNFLLNQGARIEISDSNSGSNFEYAERNGHRVPVFTFGKEVPIGEAAYYLVAGVIWDEKCGKFAANTSISEFGADRKKEIEEVKKSVLPVEGWIENEYQKQTLVAKSVGHDINRPWGLILFGPQGEGTGLFWDALQAMGGPKAFAEMQRDAIQSTIRSAIPPAKPTVTLVETPGAPPVNRARPGANIPNPQIDLYGGPNTASGTGNPLAGGSTGRNISTPSSVGNPNAPTANNPFEWSNARLQGAVDSIHAAQFPGGGGQGVPISVTVTPGGRVVVSQVGRVPGQAARAKAIEIFGENVEFVRGTTGGNAPGVAGSHAEARGINFLGEEAQGAKQATTHYACPPCEDRQVTAGVENITGTQSQQGQITRPINGGQ